MQVHGPMWKDLYDIISLKSTKLENTTNIMIPVNLTKHVHMGLCACVCVNAQGRQNLNVKSGYLWRKERYEKERGETSVKEDHSLLSHHLASCFKFS